MPTIFGLSGSLRKGIIQQRSSARRGRAAPAGTIVETAISARCRCITPMRRPRMARPLPSRSCNRQMAAADALLLSTPEYNNSIPGVFKECHRLDVAGEGLKDFCRQAGGDHGCPPGGFGTIPAATPAAGAADPEGRALGRGPVDGVTRRRALRRDQATC